MNEETAVRLVCETFSIPKPARLTVTKRGTIYSMIYKIEADFNSRKRTYYLKSANDSLEQQWRLAKNAEEFFYADKTYKPLAVTYIEDCNVLLSEGSEHNTFAQTITQDGFPNPFKWYKSITNTVVLVGRWLSKYHSQKTAYGSIAEPLSRYVNIRSEGLKEFESDLRDSFLRAVNSCPDDIIAPAHSDYSPQNILSDGKTLSVIDFGISEWTHMSPCWDIATIQIALERDFLFRYRNPLRWLPTARKKLIEVFNDAYGPHPQYNPESWAACVATRHFTQFCGIISRDRRDPRLDWHVECMKKALAC